MLSASATSGYNASQINSLLVLPECELISTLEGIHGRMPLTQKQSHGSSAASMLIQLVSLLLPSLLEPFFPLSRLPMLPTNWAAKDVLVSELHFAYWLPYFKSQSHIPGFSSVPVL